MSVNLLEGIPHLFDSRSISSRAHSEPTILESNTTDASGSVKRTSKPRLIKKINMVRLSANARRGYLDLPIGPTYIRVMTGEQVL